MGFVVVSVANGKNKEESQKEHDSVHSMRCRSSQHDVSEARYATGGTMSSSHHSQLSCPFLSSTPQ